MVLLAHFLAAPAAAAAAALAHVSRSCSETSSGPAWSAVILSQWPCCGYMQCYKALLRACGFM